MDSADSLDGDRITAGSNGHAPGTDHWQQRQDLPSPAVSRNENLDMSKQLASSVGGEGGKPAPNDKYDLRVIDMASRVLESFLRATVDTDFLGGDACVSASHHTVDSQGEGGGGGQARALSAELLDETYFSTKSSDGRPASDNPPPIAVPARGSTSQVC